MKLLLSVIIVGILLLVFEKQIKRYSVVCYLVCVLLGILDVFLPKNLYPNWFSKFVTNYFQRGILATALFIIVMYAVLCLKGAD